MISIVIPAHNEATQLPATLATIEAQSGPHEVIVVNAVSTDATAQIAANRGARVIESSRRHRAAQMNAGARIASGDTFLFLHADTRLASAALQNIRTSLRRPEVVGGGFARRYDSSSLLLAATCALAEIRTRCCGWFLGDQAIFVRRTVFEQLGGFPEWDLFEDLELSRRLARVGRLVTLRPAVISAARRFDARGVLRTTWSDLCLTARYLAHETAPVGKPASAGAMP